MSRWLRALARLFLLFAIPCCAPASAEPPRFTSVAPQQIPSGVISSLTEDSRGFLWLGTPAGLVRYDGYRFRTHGDHWSLPGSEAALFVRSLLAEPEGGRLWVGTDFAGLLRYDPMLGRLRRVPLTHAHAPLSINALALESDGTLWAGSDGEGLFRREADGGVHRFEAGPASGLLDDRIDSLLLDHRGSLWVGSWSGLLRFDKAGGRFETVTLEAGRGEPRISALYEDNGGRIWIGTRQGALYRWDAQRGVERLGEAGRASPAVVFTFLQTDEDTLWVGRGDGIEIRSLDSGAVRAKLRHRPDVEHGLAGNEVRALIRDRGGLIWVAGYGGGLQRHNPHNAAFRVHDRHSRLGRLLGDPNIRAIASLRDGRFLLGSQDRGVALVAADLAPIDLLRDASGRPLFDGTRISGLAEDADSSWWIGGDAGLYRLREGSQALETVDLGARRIRRLGPAADGGVWVATEAGLLRARAGETMATALPVADGPALDRDVNAMAYDEAGTLWIGGDQGLLRLPATAQQAGWVPVQHALRRDNHDVLGLLVDAEGALWFDTPRGLFRRTGDAEGGGQVKAVGIELGAPPRPFGANLLADSRGRIWTQHHMLDPDAGRLVALGPADGVDIGSAWFRAYARGRDGSLLFGGSRGLLHVEPDRYRLPDYDAPLVISELLLDGEPLPVPEDRALAMSPGQRRLSVEFAALDYSAPEQLRYRHRISGESPQWQETDAAYRRVILANLDPGSYQLEVEASDRHGRWTAQRIVLSVEVIPAWWQRRMVHALAAALVLAVGLLLLNRRNRRQRLREAQLELRVEERTRELQALSARLKEKSDALEQASLTDPLTGLRNRRFFAEHIDEDVMRSRRRHRAALDRGEAPRNADLVFFLVDLDHFKQVNDEHGHAAGDAVLIQMRERLQACFRDIDHLVRWGGEEFLVVSRDSDRQRAAELAGRAVRAVADFAFELPGPRRLRCTCSVGYAALPLQPAHPERHGWAEAVELADLALYAVKHAGRNGWVGIEATGDAPLSEALPREAAGLIARGVLRLRSSIAEPALREALETLVPSPGLDREPEGRADGGAGVDTPPS
ncbi:ligand-binding sensor domain-containing diguanylate cyclase [Pseudomarimonas salicorniae]|uniref:diguanylate cyclase n=1 Tax=Pseudomarimonas salicorniae TaxID=2933270 RepID=A0ABT0GDX1_9GAMM|nr:ligand-binding sensor domain-containing diguanylate cyclase [Lysobacter sp. CAU 1642]MCK7592750.1 diguanylate cyclase [Lysobacter sp. CAU 1642]